MPQLPDSLFISHGSPMRALGGHPTVEAWAAIGRELPRPRAVVVASAHWLTRSPRVGAAAAPETIHDFYGFPPALNELRYPAPGAPALAEAVAARLTAAGFAANLDPARGLDHGVWVPLRHFWPEADVPVLPLSIQPAQNAQYHYELGRSLHGLRDDGVLVIGSGSLTHNLHDAALGDDDESHAPGYVPEFRDWVAQHLAEGNTAILCDYRRQAPGGLRAHPTDEHFLPLFVALGAAGEAPLSERLFTAINDGAVAMDVYAFSARQLARAA